VKKGQVFWKRAAKKGFCWNPTFTPSNLLSCWYATCSRDHVTKAFQK
jgi:inosine/xanthosine triphosphate pyrophosphatase family protein